MAIDPDGGGGSDIASYPERRRRRRRRRRSDGCRSGSDNANSTTNTTNAKNITTTMMTSVDRRRRLRAALALLSLSSVRRGDGIALHGHAEDDVANIDEHDDDDGAARHRSRVHQISTTDRDDGHNNDIENDYHDRATPTSSTSIANHYLPELRIINGESVSILLLSSHNEHVFFLCLFVCFTRLSVYLLIADYSAPLPPAPFPPRRITILAGCASPRPKIRRRKT